MTSCLCFWNSLQKKQWKLIGYTRDFLVINRSLILADLGCESMAIIIILSFCLKQCAANMFELIGYTGGIKINRSLALTGLALKSISITVRIRFRELRKRSLYWSNNFDSIAMVPLTNYFYNSFCCRTHTRIEHEIRLTKNKWFIF